MFLQVTFPYIKLSFLFYQKSKFHHHWVTSFLFSLIVSTYAAALSLHFLFHAGMGLPSTPFPPAHKHTHFKAHKAVPCLWEQRLCLHWFKSRITMPRTGIRKNRKGAQANIPAFGLKPLLPEHKPHVCHAIASGWPRRPTSPTLYFSCTKPIIKSINNWAFFPPVLLNLFLLYISSEMKGRHAGGSVESAGAKRKEWRKKRRNENSSVALCLSFWATGVHVRVIIQLRVFQQWAS